MRDRREDIPALVAELALRIRGAGHAQLPADVVQRLAEQPWTGNVRELRNAVERLLLLGSGDTLVSIAADAVHEDRSSLEAIAASGLPYRQARAQILDAFTKRYVEDMLVRHGGNVSAASRAAGIARRHLHRLKRS